MTDGRDVERRGFASTWWLLPQKRVQPQWWIPIAAVMLSIDYATGPHFQFPVVYAVPVGLAAWYSGLLPALALTMVMPSVHFAFMVLSWGQPGDLAAVATTAIRGVLVGLVALAIARLSQHERELSRKVQVLEGLLPICSFCKDIRNDAGEWELMETFISRRTEAQFSHGFCPTCLKLHYPGVVGPQEDAAIAARRL